MGFNKPDILRMQVDGKEIFHEVEFSLDGSTDFEEIATKDSNGKVSSPGSQSWSASVSAVANDETTAKQTELTMQGLWKNKTLSPIEITDGTTGHVKYSGNAYVENFSLKAGVEGMVDLSWSFKGSGELTIAAVA